MEKSLLYKKLKKKSTYFCSKKILNKYEKKINFFLKNKNNSF